MPTAPGRIRGRGPGRCCAYHRADLLAGLGDADGARAAVAAVRTLEYCFPNRPEDALVLSRALDRDPADARAASLLGDWLYHHHRYDDAIACWRRAVEHDPSDVVAWRNLGVAAFNVQGDTPEATACYDRALALAPDDAKLWYESDQLAKRTGTAPQERLTRLERRRDVVAARDDLTIEYVLLLVATGQAGRALDVLTGRRFQPWEGGEGQVLFAWEQTRLSLARAALAAGDAAVARGARPAPRSNRPRPWARPATRWRTAPTCSSCSATRSPRPDGPRRLMRPGRRRPPRTGTSRR